MKDQAKAHSRDLKRTDRELVRDRHKIEAEEQRLVSDYILHRYIFISLFLQLNEIRKTAATGNKKVLIKKSKIFYFEIFKFQALETLAKQLVKVRNQKAQSLQASGHIQGLATQSTMMASNVRMANAMDVSYLI